MIAPMKRFGALSVAQKMVAFLKVAFGKRKEKNQKPPYTRNNWLKWYLSIYLLLISQKWYQYSIRIW